MNLIPKKTNEELSGNYYCTWGFQGGAVGIDENKLFGENGLLVTYPQALRSEVIAVLDDGWDIPYNVRNPEEIYWYGVGYPDPERFPSTKGMEPKEALKWLVDKIKSLGFAGAGFWIPMQTSRKTDVMYDMNDYIAHWTECAKWANYAGVVYWKADWGQHYWNNADARENLKKIVNQYAPNVLLEQAHVTSDVAPEPDFETVREREARERHILHIFNYADYYRTYDCGSILGVPTTVTRLATLMKIAPDVDYATGARHMINVEDDLYMAGAFGCTAGIMRHPVVSQPGKETALETVRYLNWQHIMPPFALAADGNFIDEERIANKYIRDDKSVLYQSAPARLSRNMPLAEVSLRIGQYQPWILCAKHPQNGAVGIFATRRTVPGWINCWCYADITAEVGAIESPVGVFGESYYSLTLIYDKPIGNRRIYVQDLADDTAYDVTDIVTVDENKLTVDREFINEYGKKITSGDDKSMPAFVLKILEN